MIINRDFLEKKIWESSHILRGTLNPDEILIVISRILVLKRLIDEFKKESNKFSIPNDIEWISLRDKTAFLNFLGEIEKENIYFKDVLLTLSFEMYFNRIDDALWENVFEYLNESDFNLSDKNLETPCLIGEIFRDFIDFTASKTGARGGIYYTPNDISWLMISILEPNENMIIYDPACGSAGLLIDTSEYLHSIKKDPTKCRYFGQEISVEIYALAKISVFLHNLENITIELGDTIREPKVLTKEKNLLKFDLILADPPWMMRNWGREQLIENDPYDRLKYGIPPSDSADWMWIQHIIASLRANGRAAVILNKGALFRQREKSIREGIIKDDLIEAIIDLPPNLFYISSLSASILILNKEKNKALKNNVFFLKIDSDEKKRESKNSLSIDNLKQILDSYRKKEVKNFISNIIETSQIEDYDYNLNPGLYINDISEIAKKRGLLSCKLKDLIIEINQLTRGTEEEFDSKLNSFYLPMIGISPACNSPEEFSLKSQNYYQVVLNQDLAYSEYACGFFNTDLGYMTREQISMGTTIPKISKLNLLNSRIYLPHIEIQKDVIDTMSKIQEFSVQLEEFKKKMWTYPSSISKIKKEVVKYNRKESFVDWIETLPFPIASILWRYHSDLEREKKLEHLLNFFEATTTFFGTLMLSALKTNDGLFKEYKEKIFTDKEGNFIKLEKSYFGQWVIIDKRLANILKKILDKDFNKCIALFKINSREILNFIFNKNIYNLLEKVSLYRNKWKGHTSITSESLINDRLVLIQKELTNFRRIISDKFEELLFILPERDLKIIDGILYQNSQILIGSRMIYKRERIPIIQHLDTKSIYMAQKNNFNPLELIPFFQIMPSPKEENIACYFYDRLEEELIHWNSYHFKDPSEKSESNERLSEFINKINT